MPTVFLIHGTYGYPTENWFPWLKQKLEERGCTVIAPQLPTPEGQNLDRWLEAFEPYKAELNEQSILVGHSVGATFSLRLLERLDHPVRAVALVGGFARTLTQVSPLVQVLLASFVAEPFDWERIRSRAAHFLVFQSDSDPYIPFEVGGELARNLETEIIIVKNAGHFNEAAGFTRFDLLYTRLAELL